MIHSPWKSWPPLFVLRRRWNNGTLLSTVSIRIDSVNRQIVVRFGEFPAAIFSAFHFGLVREQLLFHFTAMSGGRDVLIGNDDAKFPSSVFPRMVSRPIDGIGRHVAQFLLAVQSRDLIFFKELPEFVRVTPLHFVNPFDKIGFFRRGGGGVSDSLLAARLRNAGKRDGHCHCCK